MPNMINYMIQRPHNCQRGGVQAAAVATTTHSLAQQSCRAGRRQPASLLRPNISERNPGPARWSLMIIVNDDRGVSLKRSAEAACF
jgi:hypothetical protein